MYSNLLGEFIGTMTLTAFGTSIVANLLLKDSKGNGAGWVHINWGWAFALMMGIYAAWAFGAPEGDLNPVVTLFKLITFGTYTVPHAIATMMAEMAGGIAGGVVTYFVFLNHWEATDDPGIKLGVFGTGPARRDLKCNFLTETIATFFLIMGIQCIVRNMSGDTSSFLLPFMIGGLLYTIGAGFGGPTGYGMNPAVTWDHALPTHFCRSPARAKTTGSTVLLSPLPAPQPERFLLFWPAGWLAFN